MNHFNFLIDLRDIVAKFVPAPIDAYSVPEIGKACFPQEIRTEVPFDDRKAPIEYCS